MFYFFIFYDVVFSLANLETCQYLQILETIRSLPVQKQKKIIDELIGKAMKHDYISSRREKLLNKQAGCPYCISLKFYRHGYAHDYMMFMAKNVKRPLQNLLELG